MYAGQRAETFAIDLGAVFDTVNLRVGNGAPIPGLRPPLPVMTAAEDANDFVNPFGVNNFSGFNVNTITLEVPIKHLTSDGQAAGAANGVIGMFAATSRQAVTVRTGAPRLKTRLVQTRRGFRQVSRMANPLVNELIIPIGAKDVWNASRPEDEAQFLEHFRRLDVATALELVSGVPVPPTAVGQIKRLTILAHDAAGNATPDPAGFPNGRRPNDDVTDLVVRVAGGPNYITNFVGDGVGVNEKGITAQFPFQPTPFDGRNRRHVDPGE